MGDFLREPRFFVGSLQPRKGRVADRLVDLKGQAERRLTVKIDEVRGCGTLSSWTKRRGNVLVGECEGGKLALINAREHQNLVDLQEKGPRRDHVVMLLVYMDPADRTSLQIRHKVIEELAVKTLKNLNYTLPKGLVMPIVWGMRGGNLAWFPGWLVVRVVKSREFGVWTGSVALDVKRVRGIPELEKLFAVADALAKPACISDILNYSAITNVSADKELWALHQLVCKPQVEIYAVKVGEESELGQRVEEEEDEEDEDSATLSSIVTEKPKIEEEEEEEEEEGEQSEPDQSMAYDPEGFVPLPAELSMETECGEESQQDCNGGAAKSAGSSGQTNSVEASASSAAAAEPELASLEVMKLVKASGEDKEEELSLGEPDCEVVVESLACSGGCVNACTCIDVIGLGEKVEPRASTPSPSTTGVGLDVRFSVAVKPLSGRSGYTRREKAQAALYASLKDMGLCSEGLSTGGFEGQRCQVYWEHSEQLELDVPLLFKCVCKVGRKDELVCIYIDVCVLEPYLEEHPEVREKWLLEMDAWGWTRTWLECASEASIKQIMGVDWEVAPLLSLDEIEEALEELVSSPSLVQGPAQSVNASGHASPESLPESSEDLPKSPFSAAPPDPVISPPPLPSFGASVPGAYTASVTLDNRAGGCTAEENLNAVGALVRSALSAKAGRACAAGVKVVNECNWAAEEVVWRVEVLWDGGETVVAMAFVIPSPEKDAVDGLVDVAGRRIVFTPGKSSAVWTKNASGHENYIESRKEIQSPTHGYALTSLVATHFKGAAVTKEEVEERKEEIQKLIAGSVAHYGVEAGDLVNYAFEGSVGTSGHCLVHFALMKCPEERAGRVRYFVDVDVEQEEEVVPDFVLGAEDASAISEASCHGEEPAVVGGDGPSSPSKPVAGHSDERTEGAPQHSEPTPGPPTGPPSKLHTPLKLGQEVFVGKLGETVGERMNSIQSFMEEKMHAHGLDPSEVGHRLQVHGDWRRCGECYVFWSAGKSSEGTPEIHLTFLRNKTPSQESKIGKKGTSEAAATGEAGAKEQAEVGTAKVASGKEAEGRAGSSVEVRSGEASPVGAALGECTGEEESESAEDILVPVGLMGKASALLDGFDPKLFYSLEWVPVPGFQLSANLKTLGAVNFRVGLNRVVEGDNGEETGARLCAVLADGVNSAVAYAKRYAAGLAKLEVESVKYGRLFSRLGGPGGRLYATPLLPLERLSLAELINRVREDSDYGQDKEIELDMTTTFRAVIYQTPDEEPPVSQVDILPDGDKRVILCPKGGSELPPADLWQLTTVKMAKYLSFVTAHVSLAMNPALSGADKRLLLGEMVDRIAQLEPYGDKSSLCRLLMKTRPGNGKVLVGPLLPLADLGPGQLVKTLAGSADPECYDFLSELSSLEVFALYQSNDQPGKRGAIQDYLLRSELGLGDSGILAVEDPDEEGIKAELLEKGATGTSFTEPTITFSKVGMLFSVLIRVKAVEKLPWRRGRALVVKELNKVIKQWAGVYGESHQEAYILLHHPEFRENFVSTGIKPLNLQGYSSIESALQKQYPERIRHGAVPGYIMEGVIRLVLVPRAHTLLTESL